MNHSQNENQEELTEQPEIAMADEQTQVADANTPEEQTTSVPETELETLKIELDKARAESNTNLEGWQRSRAEFTNYKRRTQQQITESKEAGALDALSKVLPVIDDFNRAINNVPEDLQAHPWVTGTALILKNVQKILDEYNITEIDPLGEEFNPNMHEAIGMEDSAEYGSGIVSTTLQKGYRSGDKVLRPALVRVAN